MALSLPVTTDEQVAQFQAEYQSAFSGGSQQELESAKCRLVWALVHAAASRTHLQRGLDLAEAALEGGGSAADVRRELRYLAAVAQYNLNHTIKARRSLKALLEEYPDFRQAQALASECDDLVLRDGLMGVGVIGAALAIGIGILAGAGRR
ncbi:MAG: hypothetical protein J3K34DRAFT_430089 [Monoraphidium minutum]|nr:MAG: hypothetical protein J3K34DRAFT_430089 [Monoraphidium minutum]